MTGKRTNQRIAFWIFRILGLIVVGILFWILGFIIWHGAGVINWKFLTTAPTDGMTGGGIFPAIVGTFCLIAGSMVVAFPLGVMSAIYTTEYAGNGKIVRFIRIMTNNLGSIPSIIFGLVGMLFFIQMMGLKTGVLAGGLTLVVMILPTIVRTTQESLKTVPQSYREGALALGAGKWRMVRTVVLPNATVKIFLTASAEARAQRRAKELAEKGQPADFATVLADIRQRDYQDSHRAVAPLKQADDAILVDTSSIGLQESFDLLKRTILAHI